MHWGIANLDTWNLVGVTEEEAVSGGEKKKNPKTSRQTASLSLKKVYVKSRMLKLEWNLETH